MKHTIPEVLIYQPAKTAMQSAFAKSEKWFLKFTNYKELEEKYLFQIMNWNGGKDTLLTINIPFDSAEEAVKFAKKHGFKYNILANKKRLIKPKSYTSNFV